MKIVRYDQQHIAIRFTPVGMWFLGLVFVALAAFGVLFLGTKNIFECARGGPNPETCTLTQQSLFKTKAQTIPLDQMVGARLQTSTDSDGNETYKVILVTSAGDIPMTSYSSSGYSSHRRKAEQINAFFQDMSQTSLSVTQDSRMLLYIIGAVFGGIGLLVVLLTSRITLDLDRSKGLATLKRVSLITSNSDEILLGDLAGAEVETSHGHDGNTYRVALLQHSGQRTPLTSYYSSGYKGKKDLADAINQLLQGRQPAHRGDLN